MVSIAILDDYQNVALQMADWSRLQAGHRVVVFDKPFADLEAAAQALQGFDVLGIMRERTPFPRALFERLPDLELLVTTGKRNAAVDMEAAKARNVLVCGTEAPGHATAELAVGLMLALARHILRKFRQHAQRSLAAHRRLRPRRRHPGADRTGQARRAGGAHGAALGMKVIAWSQNLTPERAEEAGAERVEKDDLFKRADVVSIHTVLSQRTRGLVGARELALMKPTALLINTSRGPIIEEAALIAALKDKRIAGYGGDVYDAEPLPAIHPLRSEPRALLTPHIGYVTEETYRVFYGGTVAAIEGWLAGKPVGVLA